MCIMRYNEALPQDPETAGRACQAGLPADPEGQADPADTLRLACAVGHPSGDPPPYVSSTCLLHNA